MDYQDSARVEEAAIKRPCQRVRNPFVATGDHRIAGWAQQAASQDPGIISIDSKKARFPIEEAFRPRPSRVLAPTCPVTRLTRDVDYFGVACHPPAIFS